LVLFVLTGVAAACASSEPGSFSPDRNAAVIEAASGRTEQSFIAVNQAGYRPAAAKRALLVGTVVATRSARLVNADTQVVEAFFESTRAAPDIATSRMVSVVDFTTETRPGKYRIESGRQQSLTFRIGEDVYDGLMKSALRSFYLQRCGVALADRITGISHAICHTRDATPVALDVEHPFSGEPIVAAGGWHDAGDFGKYVATTAISVARLLAAYEDGPQRFVDGQLDIPESGNGMPDILDEARVGLEWLLRMQRQDGSVYRKVAGSKWPEPMSPDLDAQPRFAYGISSPETAKVAAVMARAVRVYQPIDDRFAQRCATAALNAWNWLEGQPRQVIDQQPGDDSGSGPYMLSATDRDASLSSDNDDRFWAAAELYATWREPRFLHYIESHRQAAQEMTLFEWKNPSSMGVVTLLGGEAAVSAELSAQLQRVLARHASETLRVTFQGVYRLANERFIWGSNKMALEEGVLLVRAYQQSHAADLLTAAQQQLDFVMGVNPFGLSFVSATSERSVAHPAHLFGRALERTIPGLLVGGPNSKAQDQIAPADRGILSYVDDARAYSVNEYAIDYNAALIGLIAALNAVYDRSQAEHAP
jgi:endoglucanase